MALKEVTYEELDSVLSCSIDEDGYSASLTVNEELQLREITEQSLKHYLDEHDICVGVIPLTLKRILNAIKKSTLGTTAVIARGTPKEDSIQGALESKFNFIDDPKVKGPKIRPIRAGQVVVTYKPAHPGKPGIKINGELDKPENAPEPPLPIAGQNLQTIEEEGSITLIAMTHGHLQKVGDIYSILDEYTYNGNIIAEMEPLSFKGSLVINGTVEKGAQVSAAKNITVAGSIEHGAQVKAGENLTVKNIIQCGTKTPCRAQGTIVAKSCLDSTIIAGVGIIIQQNVTNSSIYTKGKFATKEAVIHNSTIETLKGCLLHSVGIPEKTTINSICTGTYIDPDDPAEKLVDPNATLIIQKEIYGDTQLLNGSNRRSIKETQSGPTTIKFRELE